MFTGWHLLGKFPDGDPDDVGSWLLHHGGEAALLEVPPGLAPKHVDLALKRLDLTFAWHNVSRRRQCLKFVMASHDHEDHLDVEAWKTLVKEYPRARFIHPTSVTGDLRLSVGGEPLWLLKAPKHSLSDVVTVFRGVAMTGDIELGMLASVNDEVPEKTKRRSMKRLLGFPDRNNYHVHSTVSAHVNDVRIGVDWSSLFTI